MITKIFCLLLLFAPGTYASQDAKNWYIGLGSILSNSLPGTTGGTKYNINLARVEGFSEKVDFKVFYDGNFNSSSQGSSGVSVFGAGASFFTAERRVSTSAFLQLDLGYGGANRFSDAGPAGGIGVGVQFFRTESSTFELILRRSVIATTAVTGIGSYPTIDQLRLGIYF